MASNEPKTARIDARMPESVHLLLVRAAELQGRTLSDFVVCSAREAAEEAIAKHEIIHLSVSDQERFADALLNPPPVSDALRRAAARHENVIEPS
ncbi:type II toxin-antitoxin system TacA family antitoxin [Roseimaritima ulvae]|uniref:DUF1778 domain-containing protein n=1 Tax=Roseimaritima ulvae TaxID=980254 RepID=A0A5B9RA88_9BACT|nr:DUF1778 domain-containing protein [Roseimaritima ulvae]QEG43803.1 hypothetical protein UC8_58600 [Roseimaritima ulvae]